MSVNRVAELMVRFRTLMFGACLLVTVLVYPLSQNIRFDHSVRSLFAKNNSRLRDYYAMVEDFGSDTVCLAVYRDSELLSADGLNRLAEFTQSLSELTGVDEATSLAGLPRPRDPEVAGRLLRNVVSSMFNSEITLDRQELFPTLQEWFQRPEIDRDLLRTEILDCELYRDVFIGDDGETAAVVVVVDRDAMASGSFETTLEQMRDLAGRHPFHPRIVGSPVLIGDVYDYLAEDARTLTYVSTLTMALVILVLFRNLRWVVLPLLVVQCSLVWTRAFMAVSGIHLSLIGTMMTALVTVIGIATCIHLAVRYLEESRLHADAVFAFKETLVKVGPAIFWTCATTAAGFAALAVSDVVPVRNFAAVMTFASMAVGATAFMLVPGGVLIGSFRPVPRRPPGDRGLSHRLEELAQQTGRHSFATTLVTGGLLAASGAGFYFLKVETDFTRYFSQDAPVLEGYRFVENHLGGAGSIQVVVDAPDDLTPEYLEKIAQCQADLSRIPGVTKVTSIADLLRFFENAMPAATGPFQNLLPPKARLDLQIKAIEAVQPSALSRVWNPQAHKLLFELRVREQQGVAGKEQLVADIEQTVERHLPGKVTITGLYVLLAFLIDSLLGDQQLAFWVSATGIFAMTTLAFRDIRLGFVAFMPNLAPIIIVLGAMGWFGLQINVATAMIGSISMGLVVDFSIHYLNRFRQERNAGHSFYLAMARTHMSTGKAMVFANLALMIGFGVLATSNFIPTMHFGILVSLAILGGLIGNLSLLPLLLRLVYWAKRPEPAAFVDCEQVVEAG